MTKQTIQLGGSLVNVGNATSPSIEEGQETKSTSHNKEMSYPEVVAYILETDGVAGLFGRSLQTRLLTNAIQGSLFSVCWRYFQDIQ